MHASPDIAIVTPDGERLLLVEVKLGLDPNTLQEAVAALKATMARRGVARGLVVAGEDLILLRDSFRTRGDDSIEVVARARLPEALLPPADPLWQDRPEAAFASQIQRWLQSLPSERHAANYPEPLRQLVETHLKNLLIEGEARATRPRWLREVS